MEKLDVHKKMKYLVDELNKHTELYDAGRPIISDAEWDKMYFELVELERQFPSLVLDNSPTQRVNYVAVNELSKVEHNHPMLSLDKTKDIEEIKSFVGSKDWIAMLKMDGLTCSLLYEDGQLIRAETRGDGYIGEDVTHNAMVIPSIPKKIPYTGRLVVDGEIICKLDDFAEFAGEYKNARNFASGSIRLLDSNECAKRKLTFVAWDIIGPQKQNSLWTALEWLSNYSFTVVPFLRSMHCSVDDTMCLRQLAEDYKYPIDGFVYKLDNCREYELMGRTDHHFRGGLAFKMYDELYETKLLDIEWTMGKTNTLTPTAIFETVNIDCTDVSRASLHNVSIIKNLGLANNCTVRVYKANQIIPQIDSCERDGTSEIKIPSRCPVCGGKTAIVQDNESEVLVCTNQNCSGKLLGRLKFFVSKPAMNIDGLSEATLEFLITERWVKKFKDIYHLEEHRYEWEQFDGFGEKSVGKILDAIAKSRNVTCANFITALSIDGVGKTAAKTLSDAFNGDFYEFIEAFDSGFDWTTLADIGDKTAQNINEYLTHNDVEVWELAQELEFVIPNKVEAKSNPFSSKTVCVTGKLNHFTRDSINEKIASLGAKASGSVSSKTDYLITNEASGSSKYKKAQELNIPIITEEEFLAMIGESNAD